MTSWDVHLKEHEQALDRVRVGLEHWMRRRLEDPGLTVGALRTPTGTGVANETVLFDAIRTSGVSEGYVARIATSDSLYLDDDLSVHYRMYEVMMAFPDGPDARCAGARRRCRASSAPRSS